MRIRSDQAILASIGSFVKQHRVNQNLTQQALANAAGINRSTLSELEHGRRSNTITLIRVMRSLGQLPILDIFQKEITRPLTLAKMKFPEQEVRKSKKPKGQDPEVQK